MEVLRQRPPPAHQVHLRVLSNLKAVLPRQSLHLLNRHKGPRRSLLLDPWLPGVAVSVDPHSDCAVGNCDVICLVLSYSGVLASFLFI